MTEPDEIQDYEDVTGYTLDETKEAELLAAQNELTFIWSNREGWPVGVIMSYVFHDGRFWVTASGQRKRIAAVRRDPRVCVVVTSRGSAVKGSLSLTYKGLCQIHDDDETKAWFYPALALHLRGPDPEAVGRFAAFLDSPRRVILEVTPHQRIGYDGTKMHEATARSSAFRGA